MRSGGSTIGLLQLNDRRAGCLNIELIRFLERLGESIGVALDRKLMEEELRQSEARYRLLHESMRDAFVSLRMDGLIMDFNHQFSTMLGYEPEELSVLTNVDLTPEKWHAIESEIVERQILARGYSDTYEKEYRRKDGSVFPVELRMVLIRDEPGNPSRMWAIARDITARKQAEATLRESEEHFHSLAENLPDIVARFDRQMRHLYVNHQAERITHLPTSLFIGKTNRELGMPEVLCDQWDQAIRHVFETAQEEQIEFAYPGPDGMTFYETRIIPEIKADGVAATVLIISRNITMRKMLERKAEIQKDQLIQASKMASLGVMAAGVAHEINNPNNSITMNAPLLLRAFESIRPILETHFARHGDFSVAGIPYSEVKDLIPELLKSLIDSAERIRVIVNGLKEYARGGGDEQNTLVDLNAACQKAVEYAGVMLRRSTERFEESYDPSRPMVIGSPTRLEQVIMNLLQNSAQALTSKKDLIRLSTKLEAKQGKVIVKVEDEGMGIAPENLDKIWDPFFTTKRTAGGTGLGLPISIGIIKDFGGEILVESCEKVGTLFTITLPAAPSPASAKEAPPQ